MDTAQQLIPIILGFVVLNCYSVGSLNSISSSDILDMSNAFKMNSVLIVNKPNTTWNNVLMCRGVIKLGQKSCTSWSNMTSSLALSRVKYYGVIQVQDPGGEGHIEPFYSLVGLDHPVIVMNTDVPKIKFEIGQQVYIYDQTNGSVWESYAVNGHDVSNVIGKFKRRKTKLEWSGKSPDSWESSRSNFHGLALKAMTEVEQPSIDLDPAFRSKARGAFTNNGTYDVTGLVSGTYFDAWELMGKIYNFSTIYYKRNDSSWATQYPNGSWIGMITNIFNGDVDFIVAPLAWLPYRYKAIDYIFPMSAETTTFFIQNPDVEALSWRTFAYPFSLPLWFVLYFMAFCFALLLTALDYFSTKDPNSLRVTKFIGMLWTTFTANFGGKPSKPPDKSNAPQRILVFTYLLAGSIMWMSYRASMTSELSVQHKTMPFNNIEGLLDSDYRVMAFEKGNSISDHFLRSKPGSIFHQIMLEKMNDDSFVPMHDGLNALTEDSKLAYYYLYLPVLSMQQHHCKIIPAWKPRFPTWVSSIALKKNSPYKKILKKGLVSLREEGNLHIIWERNKPKPPKCSQADNVKSLGIKKMFTLFLVLTLGVGFALTLLIMENMKRPSRKSPSKIKHMDAKSKMIIQSAMQSLITIRTALPSEDKCFKTISQKVDDLIADMTILKS